MTDAEAEHTCIDNHASAPLTSHACAAEPSAAAAAAAATTDTAGATAAVSNGTAAQAGACSSSSSSAAACPQDGESSVYEVNVKCIDGTTTKISVPADIRGVALKELISDKLSVPAERQRLICRGKPLKDDDILGSYVTQDGQTLHMVQRPARAEADERRGSAGGAASSAGASGQAGPAGQDNTVGPQVDFAHIFGTFLNRGVPIMARPPIGVPLVRPGMPRPVQASSPMPPPPPGTSLMAPVPGLPAVSIGGPPPPPALVPQPANLAPMQMSQNLTLVAMPAGHVQAAPPSPQHAQSATGHLQPPHAAPIYIPVPGSVETRPATAEQPQQGDGSQQTQTTAASPSSAATASNAAHAGSSSHSSSAALLATAASVASSFSAPGAQGAGPSPVGAPVALGPSLLGTATAPPSAASPSTPVVGFQPPSVLPVAAPAGPPMAPPTVGVGGPALPGQAAMGTVLVPGMGWPGPPVLPQGLGIPVPPGSVPGPGVAAPPAAAGALPAGHVPQVFEGQIMGTLLANGAPPGHIPVLPAVISEALHSAEVIFDTHANWTGASSSRSPSSGSRSRTGDDSLPWRELRRLHQQLARLLGRPGFGPVLAPRPGPDGDMDVFLTTLQNAVGQLGVAISDLQAAHQAGALDQRQRQQFGVAATHAARVLRHTASHFQNGPSRGQAHGRRHEAAAPPSNAGDSRTAMPSAAGATAPAARTVGTAATVAPPEQPHGSAVLGTATGSVARAAGGAPSVSGSRSSAEAFMEPNLHRHLNTVLEDCAVGMPVPAHDDWVADLVASSDSEEVLLPEGSPGVAAGLSTSSPDAASSAAMGAHGTQPASEPGD